MTRLFQMRRGTESALTTLQAGEPRFSLDTGYLYIGDGSINHVIGADDRWTRVGTDLTQANAGDNVLIKDSSGSTKITMVASSGAASFAGSVTTGEYLYVGNADTYIRRSVAGGNPVSLYTASNALTLDAAAIATLQGYVHNSTELRPPGNNAQTLGAIIGGTYRWANAYFVLGDYTGQVTLSLADGGVSPLAVTSKVVCSNLNADYLDGQHGAYYQTALSFPLAASLGGTGINNAGTITNATATTITGGGTLALAGYTLTVANTASVSGTNTGDVTLAAPNHGLGLTGQVITLGTPSTLTVSTTNAVTTTTHTHAITPALGLIGNGSAQYQLPVTGATPFAPVWTTATGTGIPVLATTPTLVTPVIGVATGTSLDLGATTLYGSRAITVDTGGVLNVAIGSAAGDDFTVDATKLVVEGDTGYVGIGTAAPQGQLSFNNISSYYDSRLTYAIADQNVLNGYFVNSAPYTRYLDIAAIGDSNGTAGDSAIRFLTNPLTSDVAIERVIITGSGNVGIGATVPAHKLEVNGNVLTGEYLYVSNVDTYLRRSVAAGNTVSLLTASNELIVSAAATVSLNCSTRGYHGTNTEFYPSDNNTQTLGTLSGGTYRWSNVYSVLGNFSGAITCVSLRPAADSTTALQLQNAAGTSVLNVNTTTTHVSIGTVSDLDVLGVQGALANTNTGLGGQLGIVLYNTDATAGNYTSILNNGPAVNSGIFFKNIDRAYAGQIDFVTRSLVGEYGARMSIDKVGNVGIGTTGPVSRFQSVTTATNIYAGVIGGTRYGALILTNETDATGVAFDVTSGADVTAATGGTSLFRIKNTGNVGIGIAAPAARLDVTGNPSAAGFAANISHAVNTSGYNGLQVTVSASDAGTTAFDVLQDANSLLKVLGNGAISTLSGLTIGAAGYERLNVGNGAISVTEMTAPTGTGNAAKIFAQDNGAGKTLLRVIFGSGSAITLATEL